MVLSAQSRGRAMKLLTTEDWFVPEAKSGVRIPAGPMQRRSRRDTKAMQRTGRMK